MSKVYFTDRRTMRIKSDLLFNSDNDVRRYMRVGLPSNIEALLVEDYGREAVEKIIQYARVQADFTMMPSELELVVNEKPDAVADAIRTKEKIASYYAGLNPND